jgi:hypothetical protein
MVIAVSNPPDSWKYIAAVDIGNNPTHMIFPPNVPLKKNKRQAKNESITTLTYWLAHMRWLVTTIIVRRTFQNAAADKQMIRDEERVFSTANDMVNPNRNSQRIEMTIQSNRGDDSRLRIGAIIID